MEPVQLSLPLDQPYGPGQLPLLTLLEQLPLLSATTGSSLILMMLVSEYNRVSSPYGQLVETSPISPLPAELLLPEIAGSVPSVGCGSVTMTDRPSSTPGS